MPCARCSARRWPRLVAADDRVVFYFAGHGIAADGDDGPAGYLVPADADPTDLKTLVPMAELQAALQALPCRHLLLILDCCFSGAFQWASRTRAIGSLMPKRIYKERFDRFVFDRAWQVITSAAYDQKALDVLQGRATGDRGLADDPGRRGAFAVRARAVRRARRRRGLPHRARRRRRDHRHRGVRVRPRPRRAGDARRGAEQAADARILSPAQARQGRVRLPAPEASAEPAADAGAQPLQGAAVVRRGRPVPVLRARPRDPRAAGALRRGPAAGGERRVGHRQVVGRQGRPAAAAARGGTSHPPGDSAWSPSAGGAGGGADRRSAPPGRRRRSC